MTSTSTQCHRVRRSWCTAVLTLALCNSSAWAQYDFDPNAAHEMDNPGPHVFGVVKDRRGAPVRDATILVDSDRNNFVLLSDAMGRFEITVPLGTDPARIVVRCSKPGYNLVRVTRRAGPSGARSALQFDCLLQVRQAK